MQDRRSLAFGFLGNHPVHTLIASEPLGMIEDRAPALNGAFEPIGQAGVGGAQIDPRRHPALGWQFERIEHGSGRRVQHVGLIRMPLDLAVAQTADRLCLRIFQI